MNRNAYYFLAFVCCLMSLNLLTCGSDPRMTGAKVYIQTNELEKAKVQLQSLLTDLPSHPEGNYHMGMLMGQEGKYEEMNTYFNRSLETSTVYKSKIETDRQRFYVPLYNRSVEIYNRAIKMSDGTQQEEREEALNLTVKNLQKALIIGHENAKALELLSQVYVALGEADKATNLLEEIFAKDPGNDFVAEQLAVNYMNKGFKEHDDQDQRKILIQKGADFSEKVLEAQPDNINAMKNLGYAYIELEEPDKALAIYELALTNNPNDPDLHYNKAEILHKMGKTEEAMDAFERVLELSPNDLNALVQIAQFHVDNKQWNNAISFLTRVIENKSDSPDLWHLMGDCYRLQAQEKDTDAEAKPFMDVAVEHYDKAIDLYETELETNPNDPEVWERISILYTLTNQAEKAREALEKSETLR